MGVLKNITTFFYNRKFNKLKEDYVSEYRKSGRLGDISKLQDFILDKNLRIITDEKKYGDEFDITEQIFGNNSQILQFIEESKKNAVLNKVSSLSDIFYHCQNDRTSIFDSEKFKQMKDSIINFENYYLKKEKETAKLDLRDTFTINIEELKRLNSIVKSITKNDDKIYRIKFSQTMCDIINSYSLKELNNCESFVEMNDVVLKVQQALDDIYNNDLSSTEIDEKSFETFARSLPSEKTKKYFNKIDTIRKLSSLGIDVNLNDDKMSYIDASDEERVRVFYEMLDEKKKHIQIDDFDAKDFAMVRTTEYFPKNHEMEIIDELNSRIHIRKFLSDRFENCELCEKFGNNWWDKLFSEKNSEEIKKEKEKICEKYETLSPIYRSTKHFTLNGLVSSHEYGDFAGNPYIFIDPLNEHIKADNILSINEADTYFQISREKPMKLSEKTEIMMPLEEYTKLKDNPEMLKEIQKYKNITLFSGDEKIAVDMRLDEKGYIPETIGKWGYDLESIMDKAVTKISEQYNIPISIHYYSDVKSIDDQKTNEMIKESNELFVSSIFEKFGIDEKYREGALNQSLSDNELNEIISAYGENNLKSFIIDFNENRRKELDKKRDEFYSEREQNKERDNRDKIHIE